MALKLVLDDRTVPCATRSGRVPAMPSNGPKGVPIKPRPAPSFRWIRILYRRWQTNTPYNESSHLKAPPARRGSP